MIIIIIKNQERWDFFFDWKLLLMNIHNKMWLLIETMIASWIFSFQYCVYGVVGL